MKHLLFSIAFLAICLTTTAQDDPYERLNYQATLRNAGELLTNQSIQVRFIFVNTSTSDAVYSEIQTVSTNAYGMFTAVVGEGTVESGDPNSMYHADQLLVEVEAGPGMDISASTPLGTSPRAQVAKRLDNTYVYVGDPFLVLTNNPVISVGGIGTDGGTFLVGNEEQFASINCGLASEDMTIFDVRFGGGSGEMLIRADKLRISNEDEGPENFAFDIQATAAGYGFLNRNYDNSHNWELFTDAGGNFRMYADGLSMGIFDPASGAYTSLSDKSTKTSVESMESALASVMELEPKRYEFIDNNPSKRKSIGFIAQDVKALFPELVYENETREGGTLHTMDYAGFGVIAIAAIQEQQEQIDALRDIIENLQAQVQQLQK